MKDQMRLGVIAAAAVGGITLAAAIANGDDPRGAKRAEFFETAMALRSAGLKADAAHAAIKAQSNASDADVDDIVSKSYGNANRDAASLRSQAVTLLVPEVGKVAEFQRWALAWCEPLTGMPQHTACVQANNGVQGTPMCVLGQPAGYVARVQVTPSMATRFGAMIVLGDAAAQIQANGWTPCPSE